MKTTRETKVEMDTVRDIFTCPFITGDKNSKGFFVVTKTDNLNEFEMTVKDAAEKLGIPEEFLYELISALNFAMSNVISDLKSCWMRMDELEKRINQLEE